MPALRTVARLKQLYPDDADVLYESAELYTRLWTEDAGELMAKHPDSYRVHQLAGEVYEAQNNYDQAIREYSLALDANPKLPQLHFRIGQLYLHKGAPDADAKATAEFRQELAVDPQSAVSNLALAEINRHEHKLSEAKPLYEQAVRLDPTLVAAHVGLAQILLAQHQDVAAVRELQGTVERFPNDAQVHYVLMLAYREQNKLHEAQEEMATFKRLQQLEADRFRNKMNSMMTGSSGSGELIKQ
jgi:predicted Zn-dependent protease